MKSKRIGKMTVTLGMSALLYSPGGVAGVVTFTAEWIAENQYD